MLMVQTQDQSIQIEKCEFSMSTSIQKNEFSQCIFIVQTITKEHVSELSRGRDIIIRQCWDDIAILVMWC